MAASLARTLLLQTALALSLGLQAQQPEIDSLLQRLSVQQEDTNKVNTLLNLSGKFFGTENGRSLQYANEAITLSGKLKSKPAEGRSYLVAGTFQCELKNSRQGLVNLQTAKTIFEELGDKKSIADCDIRIGKSLFQNDQNYPDALQHLIAAMNAYEILSDTIAFYDCNQLLAMIYFDTEEDSLALAKALTTQEFYQKRNDSVSLAYNSNFLGELYFKEDHTDEAIRQHSLALDIYKKLGDRGPGFGIPYTFSLLGRSEVKLGLAALERADIPLAKTKFDSAMQHYQQRIELEQQRNLESADSYLDLGNIYLQYSRLPGESKSGENLAQARHWLEEGMKRVLAINQREAIRNGYLYLSRLDSSEGKYQQAYDHYKKFIVYRDSLANATITRKSEQVKLQDEFDRKETLAKAEQVKKEAQQRLTRNLQFTAIAVFILLAAILYWNSRQQQTAKKAIEKSYTELKATQALLIQSEKMASLGELTAGIAHEIQNPLNFVNNFSDVNTELLEELKSQKAETGSVDSIEDELLNDISENEKKINHHGKRAEAIVKGMLQHSRNTSGLQEPTDLNALADEYLRLSYHGLRAKDKSFNATLQTDLDKSIGNINLVPQDFGRVLLNLYNNAFYAVSERKKTAENNGITNYEPTIVVTTKKFIDPSGQGRVAIRIKDNGNGIPQHIIDKIFQPFFTTKPTGQGTGLGLSLSYDIVKAHGGEIKVETQVANPADADSRAGGTEFTILI